MEFQGPSKSTQNTCKYAVAGPLGPPKRSHLEPQNSSESTTFSISTIFGSFGLFWTPPKTRARASVGPFFSIFSQIRVPRTRVLTPRKHVSRTRATFFPWKSSFFPSFGRQTRWKKFILIRRMQGFGVSAKAETCIFAVSQALFSLKIAAKCWKTPFFHSGNVAVVRISGSPEAPPKAQKAHFDAILSHFKHFQALWKLKNQPQEPSGKSAQKGSK